MESNEYLPESLRTEPFWEATTVTLDHLFDWFEDEISKIRSKWNSLADYDRDMLEQVISELGYGYIVDILKMTDEELQVIANYLNLVHFLKGTRTGLTLVLDLLSVKYVIAEWWELNIDAIKAVFGITNSFEFLTNQNLYTVCVSPDTFMLKVFVEESKLKWNTEANLRTFIKNYVYPVLIKLDFWSFFDETWDREVGEDLIEDSLEELYFEVRGLEDYVLFTNKAAQHTNSYPSPFRCTWTWHFRCWDKHINDTLEKYHHTFAAGTHKTNSLSYRTHEDFLTNTYVVVFETDPYETIIIPGEMTAWEQFYATLL